jgi:hypothetical protein
MGRLEKTNHHKRKRNRILPTFLNGTELSSHEWRDSFLLRYSLSPLGLPLKCDGCGDEFSINHADEVTRELIELGTMALRPAAVRDEPFSPQSQNSILLRPTILIQKTIRRLMIHRTMETEVISSSEDCGKTNMKR